MNVLNYIPDGYDEAGYIKGVPQLHGEMRFRFRPMLVSERTTILTLAAKLPPEQQDLKAAQAIKQRLVSWDIVDKSGQPVPISEEIVRRLKPDLFHKLFAVICGTLPSDSDPQQNKEEAAIDEDARLAAAIDGTYDYRAAREAADAKNSATG